MTTNDSCNVLIKVNNISERDARIIENFLRICSEQGVQVERCFIGDDKSFAERLPTYQLEDCECVLREENVWHVFYVEKGNKVANSWHEGLSDALKQVWMRLTEDPGPWKFT
ncbi:hypothetical protein [Yoonia sp. I 8.24]|uniref:hypothetical protein n=1 Tax=Yoonia sp. I 8.24 TaxID=1537229 RepID=UPI001EDCE1CF|nr:hypothetical protein [Yoonia sp. I 8.24]MCG3266620.1 hypothetical protein [Yoonia sp. I 8.24]